MRQIILIIALMTACSPGHAGASSIQPLPTIERSVRAFVVNSLAPDADVDFSIGRLDPRLRLPQCQQVLETRNTHAGRVRGPMSVEVRCNGDKPWVLYVPVQLVRYARVAVASNPIARGALIREGDLELKRRRIDARQADYLNDPREAIGQMAKRAISADQIISADQLKRPRLVRRGDAVVLSMGNRVVSVRVKGKALEDGTAGERISVVNLSSERVVEGVVTAAGEVVVPNGAML